MLGSKTHLLLRAAAILVIAAAALTPSSRRHSASTRAEAERAATRVLAEPREASTPKRVVEIAQASPVARR
jgi:hypothetical protein